MLSLRYVLRESCSDMFDGRLYLPADGNWTLDSPGLLFEVDELPAAQIDSDGRPLEAVSKGLIASLDGREIRDVCLKAIELAGQPSDEFLLEAFEYYVRNDAFLPAIADPEAVPVEAIPTIQAQPTRLAQAAQRAARIADRPKKRSGVWNLIIILGFIIFVFRLVMIFARVAHETR